MGQFEITTKRAHLALIYPQSIDEPLNATVTTSLGPNLRRVLLRVLDIPKRDPEGNLFETVEAKEEDEEDE
jgi:hypothetical protein